MTEGSEVVVVDASAMVDALQGEPVGLAVAERMSDCDLHAPCHFDYEVLSALGRINRAGRLTPEQVSAMLRELRRAAVERHAVPGLVEGAWARRDNIRLSDALYIDLADRLDTVVLTTDARLARATHLAELLTA